jgi:hypothetical protein
MTRKKALEQWKRKLANTELTPPAIWPIAKSLTNRDEPRAPTAIHGLLGLKYHPVRVSVEGELSTPRYMQAGVPQGSLLSLTLYNLYINDTPQTPGVNIALFANDTSYMRQTARRAMF